MEAALRYMKNGTATGNDHRTVDILKAGEHTISKILTKLYTKCLSERRTPTAWKNAKMMMIIFKKGNKKDLTNYRPICLLSNIYKVLTNVLTKSLEKTLDENQPREQALSVHLHKESNNINIRRGVRQGDTISPKLFTAAFESTFR